MHISRERLIELVVAAGQDAWVRWQSFDRNDAEYKSDVDLVTAVDRDTQAKLIRDLAAEHRRAAPGDEFRFVAEEADEQEELTELPTFVIDPVDGTVNFVSGLPHWCVSVAYWENGRARIGVVYAPALGEVFSAESGAGAWVRTVPPWAAAGVDTALPERYAQDRVLRVTGTERVRDAVGCSGIFGGSDRMRAQSAGFIRKALAGMRDVRRLGAAALDLCFVAAARFDLFWEGHLHGWDVAAGALIATEAGATVTPFWEPHGDLLSRDLNAGSVLAGTPEIHRWFRDSVWSGE